MTVYMHYTCHTLLFQCIFAGEYKSLSSFLTIQRLIVSKLVELYMVLLTVLFNPVLMIRSDSFC